MAMELLLRKNLETESENLVSGSHQKKLIKLWSELMKMVTVSLTIKSSSPFLEKDKV